jgi:hypothetical protein
MLITRENFLHIKNFKVSLLIFILLSFIVETSIASDWVLVTSNDDVKIFVDMQSLQIHEGDVKVWEKWAYVRPMKIKNSSLKNTYNVEVKLSIYHCDEGTSNLLQVDRYADQKDLLLLMESNSYPATPLYTLEIAPDSLGGAILGFVCKK